MMEPPGLLSMPVELIHYISSYLSVGDVISCSQTCHYLRSALNDNSVWKRYLPEQDISDLEFLEPQVQPLFKLDDTLSPICENWMHIIRKTHLLNNWKQANFVENSTETLCLYASGIYNVPKGRRQLIYKDRYIFLGRFINNIVSDSIEVWDIVQSPVLHSDIFMDHKDYDSFYIIGNNLVIVECIKVHVYEINLPEGEFPLLYSFIITEDVAFHQQVLHIGGHDFRCVGWTHSSAGQYLISNKCGEPKGIFHVWDILNAAKVGAFCPPIDCFSILLHSFEKNDWILTQQFQSGNDTFYLRFNIEKREFSDHVFKRTGYYLNHIIFYGSYVIMFKHAEEGNAEGWSDSVCFVYDFVTSKELKRRRFNNAKKNDRMGSTIVWNGVFVILCNDGFNVVNAVSLQTLSRFPCDDAYYISHQYDLHGSLFLVTCTRNQGMEVWDVGAKKKLSKLLGKHRWEFLYMSNLCTRLVCLGYKKINVVNFW